MSEFDYILETPRRGHEVYVPLFEITNGLGMICGGFARYCMSMLPETEIIIPSDIDIFCENDIVYNNIREAFINHPSMKMKGPGTEIEEKWRFVISEGFKREEYQIQLIKPRDVMNFKGSGDWHTVLDNFDFTIAKCCVCPGGFAYVHRLFHIHDGAKELSITNIHCPISTMKRVTKYVAKGFNIRSAELLKLFVDYENRSDEWKETIRIGLADVRSEEESANFNQAEFLRTMYFD